MAFAARTMTYCVSLFLRDGLVMLADALQRRITGEDEDFRMIREVWSEALRAAYRSIPTPEWLA